MSLTPDLMQRLETLSQDICLREKCELYDLEFVSGSSGKGRILRLYIDRHDQPISVEDCENVSRAMNVLLDVEDIIPGGDYLLEVSTPGLERRLRRAEHFRGALNKMIQLKTTESIMDYNQEQERIGKRLNAKGLLKSVEDTGFLIEVDGMLLKVPFSIVDRAKVLFDFDANKGQKKK